MTKKEHGWWLFPALLVATLFQNFYDISAVLSGQPLALYSYDGPIFFKLGKDLLYIALFFSALVTAFRLRKTSLSDYSIIILICLSFLFLCSVIANGLLIATLGLRWAFPFILFLLLRDWMSMLNIGRARSWMFYGLLICLLAQVYQLFFMPPVYGEILPGISARTPGIFIAPNSAAFFGCVSAACIMSCSNTKSSESGYAAILAVFISALAQSGTGIVTSLILVTFWIMGNHRTMFWIFSTIIFIAAFSNLNTLTQRETDYVKVSGGGRVEVLTNITEVALPYFTNFGKYTNATNLSSTDPERAVAVDSLLASWIGNFGILALPILFAVGMLALTRMRHIDWRRSLPCIIVLMIFSTTTIVFEAFPMNIMLVFGILSSSKARIQACKK